MKKADLFASVFAVIIGLAAIIFALIFGGNALTTAIFFFSYFVGTNLIVMRVAGEDVIAKLSNGEIVAIYGPRFWLLIAAGAIASILSGYFFFKISTVTIFAAIHFGLGSMAILTAFVSPKLIEDQPIRSKFPENDVFD